VGYKKLVLTFKLNNMKNKLKYITSAFLLILSFGFSSCEKDDDTENVSTVTTYPIVTLKGDEFVSIPVGGTFNDPGVNATIGGAAVEPVKGGDAIDPSKPGVYIVTYTATNPEGFSTIAKRYVGVIAPDAAALDLSGNYKRNAGALGVSKVTKVGTGLYTTDNIGGVAVGGPLTSAHFYHTTGTKLVLPSQVNEGGETFSAESATYKFAVGTTPAQYTWTVINPGYGTTARTFVKQ
jgi:hypothetical protein